MSTHDLGGIIHTYQKFDPTNFPSPTAPPPDLVSPAFEHLLFYGSTRRLTEEELARAIRIDPSQFRGFGPSLEALMAILRELHAEGLTVVLVTHELPSIFKIVSRCIMLDQESRSIIAAGDPRALRDECDDPRVKRFFHRSAKEE